MQKKIFFQKSNKWDAARNVLLLEYNHDNCHCKTMRERSENMKRNRIATGMKALFNQEKRGNDHK